MSSPAVLKAVSKLLVGKPHAQPVKYAQHAEYEHKYVEYAVIFHDPSGAAAHARRSAYPARLHVIALVACLTDGKAFARKNAVFADIVKKLIPAKPAV